LAGTLGEISFRQLVNAKICLLFFGREEIDLFVDMVYEWRLSIWNSRITSLLTEAHEVVYHVS